MGEFFSMLALVLLLVAVVILLIIVCGMVLEYFAKCIARGWQTGMTKKEQP